MQVINYNEILKEYHILIAGVTGSGKSVLLNGLINNVKQGDAIALFDPKKVELNHFKNDKRCLLYNNKPDDVLNDLDFLINLMMHRYKKMERQNIKKSNAYHIYIIIDELSDILLTNKAVEKKLIKLIQLARASNIHIIAATQSPSRKVITARLSLNFTCKIALKCDTKIESRQVLGVPGAELLPRYGYCLIKRQGEEIQEFFIPFKEVL